MFVEIIVQSTKPKLLIPMGIKLNSIIMNSVLEHHKYV